MGNSGKVVGGHAGQNGARLVSAPNEGSGFAVLVSRSKGKIFMELYLVQHGLAVSAEDDADRVLTGEGRAQTERAARWLKDHGGHIDVIWHSGKARARQTAEIFAGQAGSNPKVEAIEGLKPNDAPTVVAERLQGIAGNVMVVGHFPHLAKLASLLLCGAEERYPVVLKNSAVLCLSPKNNGGWALQWYVPPAQMV